VPFYTEEALLGKRVIVAYNLKAAKLRGVESRGMLLAASIKHEDGSETVEVLEASDAETGTRIKLEGVNGPEPDADTNATVREIDIDTFFSVPITVVDNIVNVNGTAFTANGNVIKTEKIKDGEVH
jgi:methionyl-tRNA synthetase